jgi:hypothetical protein
MKSILAELKNLTEKDKLHIALALLLSTFTVGLISILFNITRGEQIDYFKHRLLMLEERIVYTDKKIDDTRDKYDRQLEGLKDRTNETARKVEEQEKWIEEWKKLPSLPKPKR